MRALALTFYSLKRICRSRRLAVIMLGVPLVLALVRVIFAKSSAISAIAGLCPILCAILAAAVIYIQHTLDEASGLLAGILSSPISKRMLLASRIGAWGGVFATQMALFLITSRHALR